MALARILKSAALAAAIAAGTAAAATPPPKMHPVRAFTIVHKWSGSVTGTETEHSDAFGHRRSIITQMEMRVGRQVVKTHTRAYTVGDTTVTIDFINGTATRARNPLYARIAERMRTQRAEDFGIALIRSMGYQPTGATKTVAGERCAVWKGPTGDTCFTSDALTLETSQMMGTMRATRTATSIRRNDPGPPSAYQPDPRYRITDVDVGAIMKGIRKRP